MGTFQTDGTLKFVRVFSEGENSAVGSFMLLDQDIRGLTSKQIKDKFDLQFTPTHKADIIPPKGESISVGTVSPENYGGYGKGTQFFSLKYPRESWVSKISKL